MSFLTEFFNITEGAREAAVLCPFPHYTTTGLPYFETNPSASVNTNENLFRCNACGQGYSEAQFITKILGCSYLDAKRIQRCFKNDEDYATWNKLEITEASKARAFNMGISETVLEELSVKTPPGSDDLLSFPVFMFNHLVDIRTYNPDAKPKVKSRQGCPSGLIIPADIWRTTPKTKMTIIAAGEKDMAVARSQGFNAITLTGGEQAIPKDIEAFRDRHVAICYDNDEAGKTGAKKLALELMKVTAHVKVVTDFHQVCCIEKEDLHDFFMKYGKTKKDLIDFIQATPYYEPTEEDMQRIYPTVDLLEASKPERLNRMVRSNIQVVAVADSTFATPSAAIAEKYKGGGEKDVLHLGEVREWELFEDNAQDVLHLIDNNFKEELIMKNLKELMRIPSKEKGVKLSVVTKQTVFKCFVTDMYETTHLAVQPMEYTAYAIGCRLESGQKYTVTYKIVPHPYKGQQLVMLITDAKQANDSVSNFKITEEVKSNLDVIRNIEGNVEQKINIMTEKVKGLLGYDGNNTLIQAIDLSYHTTLQFNFGSFKGVRGYLDTIIVGESRVGKSSTADALRKSYGLGVFTSLAGNSATVPGLIGGSNKTSGGFQTRAGIIPQNHRGLIIFEEFGKSNANIVKELTDIRSSNEVRITRVSGTITLPALVRMIALTNVKNTSGAIKSIASYPNGISVITELVESAEDIARYDLIVILADRGNTQINPFWEPEEPLPDHVYQTRIRWIWSRTPEQIIISKEVGLYIMEQANALNKTYECHIKIFGTEAWKKISRLAVAVAGYVVSTDDTYENIVVTKDHVDFATSYMIYIYDNSTFKLREYVTHERQYSTIDAEGIEALQDVFNKAPSLILQLEQCASATKNMLGAGSGLNNDDLNKVLNRLSRGLFIRFNNHDIIPTERFRLGLAEIERNTVVRRIGESM